MKRTAIHLAMLCSFAVSFVSVASSQQVANIAGKWNVTTRMPGHNVTELWTIQQNGGDLTITIKGEAGEMKVTGEVNAVACRVDFKDSDGVDYKVRASVIDDSMDGSITIGKRGAEKEYLWSARRSKS